MFEKLLKEEAKEHREDQKLDRPKDRAMAAVEAPSSAERALEEPRETQQQAPPDHPEEEVYDWDKGLYTFVRKGSGKGDKCAWRKGGGKGGGKGKWTDDGKPICDHCDQAGHFSQDCPELDRIMAERCAAGNTGVKQSMEGRQWRRRRLADQRRFWQSRLWQGRTSRRRPARHSAGAGFRGRLVVPRPSLPRDTEDGDFSP